jgi:hypothetical protein
VPLVVRSLGSAAATSSGGGGGGVLCEYHGVSLYLAVCVNFVYFCVSHYHYYPYSVTMNRRRGCGLQRGGVSVDGGSRQAFGLHRTPRVLPEFLVGSASSSRQRSSPHQKKRHQQGGRGGGGGVGAKSHRGEKCLASVRSVRSVVLGQLVFITLVTLIVLGQSDWLG